VLKHEQKVTSLIHKLYEQAGKENDYATQVMLQWFIDEQVEEEKNASEIVAQLKMLGEPQLGRLLQLDHRLGKREAE
jgi:ferritin